MTRKNRTSDDSASRGYRYCPVQRNIVTKRPYNIVAIYMHPLTCRPESIDPCPADYVCATPCNVRRNRSRPDMGGGSTQCFLRQEAPTGLPEAQPSALDIVESHLRPNPLLDNREFGRTNHQMRNDVHGHVACLDRGQATSGSPCLRVDEIFFRTARPLTSCAGIEKIYIAIPHRPTSIR